MWVRHIVWQMQTSGKVGGLRYAMRLASAAAAVATAHAACCCVCCSFVSSSGRCCSRASARCIVFCRIFSVVRLLASSAPICRSNFAMCSLAAARSRCRGILYVRGTSRTLFDVLRPDPMMTCHCAEHCLEHIHDGRTPGKKDLKRRLS